MGDYLYRAARKPVLVTAEGVGVHALSYALKPARFPDRRTQADEQRELAPTFRAWETESPALCFLFVHREGTADNGLDVYAATDFRGVVLDADLGTERFPRVGLLLADGLTPPRLVTAAEDAAAWAAYGAPWRSSAECLDRTHVDYLPSIDLGRPQGLLVARLYDATAVNRGDPRRAYRKGTPVAEVVDDEAVRMTP